KTSSLTFIQVVNKRYPTTNPGASMAEPLKSTPDFPDFDTYPNRVPGSAHLLPKEGTPGAIGSWPETASPRQSAAMKMNGAAEKVGGAVGAAMNKARELPRHLNTLKSKLTLIKGKSTAQVGETADELKSTAGVMKLVIPMAVIGLMLAFFGLLCITGLFVVLIASAFEGMAGFAWAFLIVGAVYFIIAGMCGFFAYSELSHKGLAPKHTM